MNVDRELLREIISKELGNTYENELVDSDYIDFYRQDQGLNVRFSFRMQFHDHISFEGFQIELKHFEQRISSLLVSDLESYYDNSFSFSFKKNYDSELDFSLYRIENKLDLKEYLDEVIKCIDFHEKGIFPRLLDINFLAGYVGSVPFTRKEEVNVGGQFPVHLFKKMAILKWGNQEGKYLEYKEGTDELIKKYAIKKPEKYKESFRRVFEELTSHLENDPNPFSG